MGLQRLRIIGTDKPWLLKILEARISVVMVHTGLGRLALLIALVVCSALRALGSSKPPIDPKTATYN